LVANVDSFLAGKSVKDSQKLSELNVDKSGKIYFKDLGPQIGWSTVTKIFIL
jgi:very-long-chain enoyl-CoA reductase